MNINFGYCCHYSIVTERNNIAQVEYKQSQSKIFKPKIHLTKKKHAARQKKQNMLDTYIDDYTAV